MTTSVHLRARRDVTTPRTSTDHPRRIRREGAATVGLVLSTAALAVAARLPFVARPLGLALTGPVAAAVGFDRWLVVVGVVMGGTALLSLLFPSVQRLERRTGPTDQPTDRPADRPDCPRLGHT